MRIRIYAKGKKGIYVYVCLYVDGIITATKTSEEIQEAKEALKNPFEMKSLSKDKFCSRNGRSTTTVIAAR